MDEKLDGTLHSQLELEFLERGKTEEELRCRNSRIKLLTQLIEA